MFFSQRKFKQAFSIRRKWFSGRIYWQWIMTGGGKYLGPWNGKGGGNDGKEFKSGQLASFFYFAWFGEEDGRRK